MNVVNLQVGPGHACDLAERVAFVHGVVQEVGKYRLQFRQGLSGGPGPGVLVPGQGE